MVNEAACVARTIELLIAVVAPIGISMLSGVKVQLVWSGIPEQEIVTNIGPVSEAALMGVIDTTADPDWPCLRLRVPGATETEKSGVVPAVALTGATEELETA